MNGTASTNGASEPDYGHRLIPHVIDQKARDNPLGEAFSIPQTENPEDGWQQISWKEYANAIDHMARRIVGECGEPTPNTFPTVSYIGPNDARYVIFVVAAVKAGYKVRHFVSMSIRKDLTPFQALFISPRNSQEGQLSLFDKTDCSFIFFPKSYRSTVQPWLQERDMKAVEIGPIDAWFPKDDVKPFVYSKSYAEAEWDPFVALHTSGSTGIPKPIYTIHGMLALCDSFRNLSEWQGTTTWFHAWADKSKRHFIPSRS